MNFRLILKTRVAVWPFSSATYWEDFFESCNVKHISIQTFISKNFSANFFLWLLFALFHRLPIRGILSDSNFFRRRNLSVVKIFSKLSNHTPYFSVLFLLIVGAFIIRIQTSQSVNFLLILKKKEVIKTPFSMPTKWVAFLSVGFSETDFFVWFAQLLWKVVADSYLLALLDGSYIEADFLETQLPQIFYTFFDNRIAQSSGTSQKVLL